MSTVSVGQAGLNGIRDGMARAQDAATRIASGRLRANPPNWWRRWWSSKPPNGRCRPRRASSRRATARSACCSTCSPEHARVAGPAGIGPPPPVVQYDPLGRAMTEEQKQRLREQPAPPLQETLARQRLRERRREDQGPVDAPAGGDDTAPGSLVDRYV